MGFGLVGDLDTKHRDCPDLLDISNQIHRNVNERFDKGNGQSLVGKLRIEQIAIRYKIDYARQR